jgi:4-aminobutyrate aminotransferase-like enzyme
MTTVSANMSVASRSDPVRPPAALRPEAALAIDALVAAAEAESAHLAGARPAQPGGKETLDAWLERAKAVRARGGYFPYLGSGRGRGPLVELLDGSVKWDLINGIGVHMFGHGDPGVMRAVLEAALADTVMEGNLQFNADGVAFAELLVQEAARSSAMRHCFVTNSGCMANESALKICQQKRNGAPRVLAFSDCFMGRSVAMSQIGDEPGYRQGVALNVLVDYVPFHDPELGDRSTEMALWHLKEAIRRWPGQHACFAFELVQGEGGFNTAPREFHLALMQTCREAGIPVWDDEVQTFGRTTSMFAFEAMGLGEYVDVVTVGKMSQACACLYTEAMSPKAGLLSGTFSASVSSLQAGLHVMRRMRDGGFYGPDGRIARLHAAFRSGAEALIARHPEWFPPVPGRFGRQSRRWIGGVGGMMRLTPFGGDKDRIGRLLQNLFQDGVIAFLCGHGPYHLRFLPPVGVMEPAHWEPVFEILERSMARTA